MKKKWKNGILIISGTYISAIPFISGSGEQKYYTYVQFVDRTRFPEVETGEPCFYVLESRFGTLVQTGNRFP